MELNDLLAKKVPLEINREIVEDAFIIEAPIKELVKLQDIEKAKKLEDKLEKALELIRICLVDKDNNPIIKEDTNLSNAYIMEVASFIMEVNTPTGK